MFLSRLQRSFNDVSLLGLILATYHPLQHLLLTGLITRFCRLLAAQPCWLEPVFLSDYR